MPTLLQAIPTTYNGVTFRSRLEARHAVLMDTLGVEWHYEYEGYQLPSGWHVPDFWLPKVGKWLEVKGDEPTLHELQLADELRDHTGANVVIAPGPLPDPTLFESHGTPYSINESWMIACGDYHYQWTICPDCGRYGIEFDGRGDRICSPMWSKKETRTCRDKCRMCDKGYGANHPTICAAYHRARTYRFW